MPQNHIGWKRKYQKRFRFVAITPKKKNKIKNKNKKQTRKERNKKKRNKCPRNNKYIHNNQIITAYVPWISFHGVVDWYIEMVGEKLCYHHV